MLFVPTEMLALEAGLYLTHHFRPKHISKYPPRSLVWRWAVPHNLSIREGKEQQNSWSQKVIDTTSHRSYYCLFRDIPHLQWKRETGNSAIGCSSLERKFSREPEHMTLSFCRVFVSSWLDDVSLHCYLFFYLEVLSEGRLFSDRNSFYQEIRLTASAWIFHVLTTCLITWWSLSFFSLSIPPTLPPPLSISIWYQPGCFMPIG